MKHDENHLGSRGTGSLTAGPRRGKLLNSFFLKKTRSKGIREIRGSLRGRGVLRQSEGVMENFAVCQGLEWKAEGKSVEGLDSRECRGPLSCAAFLRGGRRRHPSTGPGGQASSGSSRIIYRPRGKSGEKRFEGEEVACMKK